MNTFVPTELTRATVSFCIQGMPSREQMVFKSFVRLLDHCVNHQWLYYPENDAQRTDIVVIQHGHTPVPRLASERQQIVLTVGTHVSTEAFFLQWPVRAFELENELNRLGDLVATRRVRLAAAASEAADALVDAITTSGPKIRLHQWPPSTLLTVPGRLRLATLLSARAMDVCELQRRSRLPAAVCEDFVADMQRARLISSASSCVVQLPVGPKTTEPSAVARSAKPQAERPFVPLGLLDRIRIKLGLQVASQGSSLKTTEQT
ncbi:hypothetical protein [Polaromonas sp.]|uniref:hypothetical protein n=1 Tax=Polaromonas sp. TaxID=1869339 RepID=UPI0025F53FBD|nr:hypothetical protein [Polaromonas sp.]